MWNEVYAPRCEQDVVWSRVKYKALAGIVARVRHSARATRVLPPIHLLYGPTGCGKLSTLRLLLQQQQQTQDGGAAVEDSDDADDDDVFVLHTCEVGVAAYRDVLQRILQLCSGNTQDDGGGSSGGSAVVLREATLPLHARTTHVTARLLHDTPSTTSSSPPHDNNNNNNNHRRHCRRRAFVIKFYGERADEALQQCTADFVRAYEAVRRQQQQQQQQHGEDDEDNVDTSTPSVAVTPTRGRAARRTRTTRSSATAVAATQGVASQEQWQQQQQQHCVFFVHTTHDMHSDKVDLGACFPATVLRSSAVVLFHCTPITQVSLRRRLRSVLQCELQRRRRRGERCGSRDECVVVSRKRTRLHGGQGQQQQQQQQMGSVDDVVSSADVDTVVTTSQGDVRQALLQLQWLALVPPAGASSTTTTTTTTAETATVPRSSNKSSSKSTGGSSSKATDVYMSPPSSQLCRTRVATVVDLLDEHDTVVDAHTLRCNGSNDVVAAAVVEAATSGGGDGNEGGDKDKKTSTDDDNDDALRSATRAALRDEYLCLSHATARLLTQKYSLASVLRVIGDVSPRKLLDYLANNMQHYFAPAQMAEYAACAAAASGADALRACGEVAVPQLQYTAAASLIAGGSSGSSGSDQGDDDASDGGAFASAFQLDRIALCVFDSSYRVHHHDVHTPRAFVAQRPPPYVRSAYPRTRQGGRRGWQRRRTTTAAAAAGGDGQVSMLTELQWQVTVRARLQQHCARRHNDDKDKSDDDDDDDEGSKRRAVCTAGTAATTALPRLRSEDVDLLRECLPAASAPLLCCGALDAVLLDYAPFAQRIVLQSNNDHDDTDNNNGSDKVSNSAAATAAVTTTTATLPSKETMTQGGSSASRRTTFRFAAAAPAQASNNSSSTSDGSAVSLRRCCTPLQYTLICCGAPRLARLRSDAFVLCSDAAATSPSSVTLVGNSHDVTAMTALRPMLPPGVDIDDDSD